MDTITILPNSQLSTTFNFQVRARLVGIVCHGDHSHLEFELDSSEPSQFFKVLITDMVYQIRLGTGAEVPNPISYNRFTVKSCSNYRFKPYTVVLTCQQIIDSECQLELKQAF